MNIDPVLKDFIETISTLGIKVEGLAAHVDTLRRKNERYRAALEFYGNSVSWSNEIGPDGIYTLPTDIEVYGGTVALDALKED